MSGEYNEAYKASRQRYRHSGRILRIDLHIQADDAPAWDEYAARLGVSRPEMVRTCVARCMALDGFASPAHDQPAPDEATPPAPVLVEPVKRKPGRPRKVQPEPDAPDAQQQPKRGRGRPRKNAPTE